MTTDEHRQVRGPTFPDGSLWHGVSLIDEDEQIIETCCGERYDLDDPQISISEIGERPTGLSGDTICYGCTKSTAAPSESERREGAA